MDQNPYQPLSNGFKCSKIRSVWGIMISQIVAFTIRGPRTNI